MTAELVVHGGAQMHHEPARGWYRPALIEADGTALVGANDWQT